MKKKAGPYDLAMYHLNILIGDAWQRGKKKEQRSFEDAINTLVAANKVRFDDDFCGANVSIMTNDKQLQRAIRKARERMEER
jgi:rRNA-processing protein FCF1